MSLYLLPAFLSPFPRNFMIKGNANNGSNPASYAFPAVMTHFPDIAFNEEVTGCIIEQGIGAINEAAIGAIISLRNLPA